MVGVIGIRRQPNGLRPGSAVMNRPGRRRQRRKRGCLRCGGLNAFGCLFLGLLCGMFALHNVVLRGDRFSLRASAREALALAPAPVAVASADFPFVAFNGANFADVGDSLDSTTGSLNAGIGR